MNVSLQNKNEMYDELCGRYHADHIILFLLCTVDMMPSWLIEAWITLNTSLTYMLFVFINGSLLSVRFMSVLENGTNPNIVLRISFMRWHAIILFLQLNFAECQSGSRFRPLSTTDNIFSKLSQSISDSVAHLTKEVNALQRPCMSDNYAMTRLNKQQKTYQTAALISSCSADSSGDELEQFLFASTEAPEGDDWRELKEFFHSTVDVGEPLNVDMAKAINNALWVNQKPKKYTRYK